MSSLWSERRRQGVSPLSLAWLCSCAQGVPKLTCPGAAGVSPREPGRWTACAPAEQPLCFPSLRRSPSPPGTSSSGPRRPHRRPPGSAAWSSTWWAESRREVSHRSLAPGGGPWVPGPDTDFWSRSPSTRRTAAYCTLASVRARRTLSWAARFCSRYTRSWSYFFSCSSNSFCGGSGGGQMLRALPPKAGCQEPARCPRPNHLHLRVVGSHQRCCDVVFLDELA